MPTNTPTIVATLGFDTTYTPSISPQLLITSVPESYIQYGSIVFGAIYDVDDVSEWVFRGNQGDKITVLVCSSERDNFFHSTIDVYNSIGEHLVRERGVEDLLLDYELSIDDYYTILIPPSYSHNITYNTYSINSSEFKLYLIESINHGVVNTGGVDASIRASATTNSRVMRTESNGSDLPIIGRNNDGTWLRVAGGWISASLLKFDGDLFLLPVHESYFGYFGCEWP